MIQGKGKVIFKLFLAVVILMSFLGSWSEPAIAGVTCTWEGSTANWETSTNWSCDHVPASDDIVIIPDTAIDPIFSNTSVNFRVGEIQIGSGAVLTVINNDGGERNFDANNWQIDGTLKFSSSAYSYNVNLNSTVTTGVVNVSSTGQINFDVSVGALRFYSQYNNDGSLRHKDTGDCAVLLAAGGSHNGVFNVKNLQINAVSQNFYFLTNSELNIPDLNVTGGNVYIYGTYNPSGDFTNFVIENYLMVSPPAAVWINSTNVIMPNYTSVLDDTTLNTQSELSLRNLTLAGTLNNTSTIDVTNDFKWANGGFTGSGTTTITSTATRRIYPYYGGTMNAQTLIFEGTTNWDEKNITFSNGAEIINNGTFNANATTTMTGGTTEGFTNNGSFYKNTAGTTTTMNIPFVNNDTVQVVAGSLVFLQGIDNGEDVVIDLGGGTLDPGDELTLESGDSLIGSGTLEADLVNGGTVSPGDSPGRILVEGNYTQEAAGVLNIELGGTDIGMGYDQLEVKGVASLAGTLNVSLINEFEPVVNNIFNIMLYASKTGEFSTVNLPPGYDWTLTYDETFLKISGEPVDSYIIFLPLILK